MLITCPGVPGGWKKPQSVPTESAIYDSKSLKQSNLEYAGCINDLVFIHSQGYSWILAVNFSQKVFVALCI